MSSTAGPVLRHWRQVRHLSQLDLSVESGVSQRHLSCVETGKAQPSRQLLLHLARVLDIPLRDRNALLQAGGFAAVYPQTGWDDPELAEARRAVEFMIERHDPYPAIVLDRHWNLVTANAAAARLIGALVGPDGLAAAAGNAMRLIVHPDGMRRAIVNWSEVGGHLLDRVEREAAWYPDDDDLQALAAELRDTIGEVDHTPPDAALPMLIPTRVRTDGGDIAMFSMLATVGGALDVTLSELVVELFYPADDVSGDRLANLA